MTQRTFEQQKQFSQRAATEISNEVEQNHVNQAEHASASRSHQTPRPEASARLPAGFSYCLLCSDMRQQRGSSSPARQSTHAWSELSLW